MLKGNKIWCFTKRPSISVSLGGSLYSADCGPRVHCTFLFACRERFAVDSDCCVSRFSCLLVLQTSLASNLHLRRVVFAVVGKLAIGSPSSCFNFTGVLRSLRSVKLAGLLLYVIFYCRIVGYTK